MSSSDTGSVSDEHAEPAERVDALVELDGLRRDRSARHAVEAVAAGDEVAVHALDFSVRAEFDGRFFLKIEQRDVLGLVHRLRTRFGARLREVLGDLGLAVDGDGACR